MIVRAVVAEVTGLCSSELVVVAQVFVNVRKE
jgi:hypothetical protein